MKGGRIEQNLKLEKRTTDKPRVGDASHAIRVEYKGEKRGYMEEEEAKKKSKRTAEKEKERKNRQEVD